MNHSLISIFLFSIIIFNVVSDDTPVIVVHYNLTEPNLTLSDPDNPITDNITTSGQLIKLPLTTLEKNGYSFQGWTDGEYGYEPGDSIRVYQNQTITPVFQKDDDKRKVYVEYYAELDGKVINIDYVPSFFIRVNSIYLIDEHDINLGDAASHGWTDGKTIFTFGQKFVVRDENITFTPVWHYRRNLIYSAGDVDGIAGNANVSFLRLEGSYTDLSILTTVTRKGYDNIGWVNDGVFYEQYARFMMPDHDTIFYALWQAKQYTINFRNGKTSDNIKIVARTEETITMPEINVENEGYTFGGWKLSTNGKVYQPNDKYDVEGLVPGQGMRFDAVWNKN